VFYCAGSLVSWSSKKQQTIALSTAEAEYLSGTQATKEAIWLQQFLAAIGVRKETLYGYPAWLYGDNQSANALANNPEYHSKTKHIHGRQRFITEMVEQGAVTVIYMPTKDMIADMLTKALPQGQYRKFMRVLGLRTEKPPSLEVLGIVQIVEYKCRQCEEEFKTRNALFKHLKKQKHEQ